MSSSARAALPHSAGGVAISLGAAPDIDGDELLFWTLLARFETETLQHYLARAPRLATPSKTDFVATISAVGCGHDLLAESELRQPIETLLVIAHNADPASTLIIQGVLLEHLGQAIYGLVQKTESVTQGSRTLAAAGLAASQTVTPLASAQIEQEVGREDDLYVVFADVSHDVLAAMDSIAEPVDRIFGERFGLHFADVMGEFTADLIATCTGLGMHRRKVVAHLAGACMGI